jgi:hypothetical protein
MTKTSILIAGLGLAAAMAASAARATDVTASFDLFDSNDTSYVGGEDVYSSPMSVQLTAGAEVDNRIAFCIDIMHNIGASVSGLAYQTIPLTTDTFGTPGGATLSTTVVEQIGGLADYGQRLIATHASDLDAQLSGVQDAIWSLEYPGTSVTANNAAAAAYLAQDLADVGAYALPSTAGITAIVPVASGSTQAFVLSAPEPEAWALMIIGVGAIGAVLRRRRTLRPVPCRAAM